MFGKGINQAAVFSPFPCRTFLCRSIQPESRIPAKIFSRRDAENAEKHQEEKSVMIFSAFSASLRGTFRHDGFGCGTPRRVFALRLCCIVSA
jgi:hypothetical protein